MAKPAVDSPTSPFEPPAVPRRAGRRQPATAGRVALAAAAAPLDSHVSIPDSKSQAAESKSLVTDAKPEPDNHAPQPPLQAASPEPHGSNAKPAQPETSAKASRDLERDGWVSVPNSGKILFDDAPDADATAMTPVRESVPRPAATHDARAYTAKDVIRTRVTPTRGDHRTRTKWPASALVLARPDPDRTRRRRVERTPTWSSPMRIFGRYHGSITARVDIIVRYGRQMPTNIPKSIS